MPFVVSSDLLDRPSLVPHASTNACCSRDVTFTLRSPGSLSWRSRFVSKILTTKVTRMISFGHKPGSRRYALPKTTTLMAQPSSARPRTLHVNALWSASSWQLSGTDHVVRSFPLTWSVLVLAIRGSSRRLSPERLRLSLHAARHGSPSEDFFWQARDIPGLQNVAAGHILAAWRVAKKLGKLAWRVSLLPDKPRVTCAFRDPNFRIAFVSLGATCQVLHYGTVFLMSVDMSVDLPWKAHSRHSRTCGEMSIYSKPRQAWRKTVCHTFIGCLERFFYGEHRCVWKLFISTIYFYLYKYRQKTCFLSF